MGANDAMEMLEVAKAECLRLEHALAASSLELETLEGFVEDIAADLPLNETSDDTTEIDFIGRFVKKWSPVSAALDAARALDYYDGVAPIWFRWDEEKQTLVLDEGRG